MPHESVPFVNVFFSLFADFTDEVDDSSVVGSSRPVVNAEELLYTLRGQIAETLRLDYPRLGIYTLEITSLKTDSYVSILTASLPDVDRFPELPRDNRVKEIGKTLKSFTVEWDPSPDEQHLGDATDYCIAVNRKRSFKTLCSVLAHYNGDPKPTLPPGNGFGFSKDLYKRQLLKQNAKPIKAAKKGSIFFQCIGKNTKATFEKVKTRRGYYVDVFVRNRLSDGTYRTKRYNGTYIKTKRKHVYPKLKNGRTRTAKFSKKKRKVTYTFYNKATKDFYLAISSCTGRTRVQVTGTNGTLLSTSVTGTDVLTIKDVTPGKYAIALKRKPSRRKALVHISVIARRNALKVPVLPEDRTVKVFDNLSTCSSITVALKGTDTKQNYCLYKTEVNSNSTSSTRTTQCGAYSRVKDGAKRIMCKKFKYSQDNAVLALTVTNLKPDTAYIFDVFVNRGKYFMFSYNSVRTKTSASEPCYLPT